MTVKGTILLGVVFFILGQSVFEFMVASCYENKYLEQDAIAYSCNPAVDCANSTPGDKVPDPYNCSNYYMCISIQGDTTPVPSDISVPCDEDSHFDMKEGDCVNGSACVDNCLNICKETCTVNGEYYFNPGDCSLFYICVVGGDPLGASCSDDAPYFNGVNCSSNPGDCCDNCKPICTDIYVETSDPCDCNSFYLCTEEGIPSEDDHFSCIEGQFFDSSVGRCQPEEDPDESCTALCSCEYTENYT